MQENFNKKPILNNIEVETKEVSPVHYKAVVVAPGFEVEQIDSKESFVGKKNPKKEHRTGLLFETRIKLRAAALMWKNKEVERVVVGGGQLRKMSNSFADLMKADLVNMGVPAEVIDTETYTRDTPTQVEWLKTHISDYKNNELDNVAFLTDPDQAKFIRELTKGQNLENVPVLETEAIILRLIPEQEVEHFKSLFKKIHQSPWGIQYKLREELETLFVKYFDKGGKLLMRLSQGRVKNLNSEK